MNDLINYSGLQIFSAPNLVTTETVKIEKSRWLRLLETIWSWNPCNSELISPDFKVIYEPSKEIFMMNGKMFAHPETIAAMQKLA